MLSIGSWITKNYEDVLRIDVGLGFGVVELDCDEELILTPYFENAED